MATTETKTRNEHRAAASRLAFSERSEALAREIGQSAELNAPDMQYAEAALLDMVEAAAHQLKDLNDFHSARKLCKILDELY